MSDQTSNNRYQNIERLGESSLFAVFKAHDCLGDRDVIVKSVKQPYSTNPTFLESLQNSTQLTHTLSHPGIAQFYEYGIDSDSHFVVSEYVRGLNLKERIRRTAPFSVAVTVDYACSLCEALHYAHVSGFVHGDLRPQNVMISPEGVVKITDFGLNRAIAQNPLLQDAIAMSAVPYKAPELTFDNSGTIEGDVYAVGAMLYEMLTASTLYTGDSVVGIMRQHAVANIPSPRTINVGIPRAVEGIILKCLQKRPQDRYRSVTALLNDLKQVRDALRFGKSLSWTPIDLNQTGVPEPEAVPEETQNRGKKNALAVIPKETEKAPEPDVEPPTQTVVIASQNKLRQQDERVSLVLRILQGVMLSVIVLGILAFPVIWAQKWVTPKSNALPKLKGKTIEEVRQIVKSLKLQIKERSEHYDADKGFVYKTQPVEGERIKEGRVLNVWYSKGPLYTDVPRLIGLDRETAEKKLELAGLQVGKVSLNYSSSYARGTVMMQDVSDKKRTISGTVVSLVVSEGPKPAYAVDNDSSGSSEPVEIPDTSSIEPKNFERVISIQNDGKKVRQVRVEYTDLDGTHEPVINEPLKEGDRKVIRFEYRGKTISLRIYYNDELVYENKNLDPVATKDQRINASGGSQ